MSRHTRYTYNVHGQWVAPAVRAAHGTSRAETSPHLAKALAQIERAYANAREPQK
jgi:hypothetical protein